MQNKGVAIAYDKGKVAFIEGDLTNPYAQGTIKFKEWQRGFDEAFANQKKVCDVQRIQLTATHSV